MVGWKDWLVAKMRAFYLCSAPDQFASIVGSSLFSHGARVSPLPLILLCKGILIRLERGRLVVWNLAFGKCVQLVPSRSADIPPTEAHATCWVVVNDQHLKDAAGGSVYGPRRYPSC